MNNAVYLEEAQYETMLKHVPKILAVTRSVLCEKYKVSGSIARALIKDLHRKNLLIPVGEQSARFDLFRGSLAKAATDKPEEDKGGKKKWFCIYNETVVLNSINDNLSFSFIEAGLFVFFFFLKIIVKNTLI